MHVHFIYSSSENSLSLEVLECLFIANCRKLSIGKYRLLHVQMLTFNNLAQLHSDMNAFRKNLNLLFVVVVAVGWDHLKAGLVALVDIHEIHLSTQILHLIGAHCQWPIFIVAGNSFTMHSSRSSRKKYSQQSITLLVGISRTTSALQTARND